MPSNTIVCVSLAVAVSAALGANCLAQEVASVDLTKLTVRRDLRRPASTQERSGARGATIEDHHCPMGPTFPGVPVNPDSTNNNAVGALRTTLVSSDRTHYQVGDEPMFEVTVENVGSTPLRIPFSPHLADLQPKDPAQKFAYSELQLVLWIAGTEGGSNTGGGVTLYGADNHADSMLTLNLGEWVRIIGKGKFAFHPAHEAGDGPVHPDAINRVYAQVILYRSETLLTATATATVRQELCLRETYGRAFPIALTGAAQ